ncbi:TlpA disulfide reductase family protein [Sediminitomix flava]|uniref:Peroxiredoxin n=1 Tax=Sediminitomix flava TaxID=379075 RepID=A0A315ZA73_SEDFL|nr:TlpA disulfide reductase family protein [Sediminitomix flava]PWJ42486.1 peroxiredoxin [Sediminitomix flava]
MRRFFTFCGAALMMASCAADKQEMVLNGTVENYEGTEVVITMPEGEEWKSDTVKIENGKFQYTKALTSPEVMRISFGDKGGVVAFAEDTVLNFTVNTDSVMGYSLEGSKTQDEYKVASKIDEKYRPQFMNLREEYEKANAEENKEEVEKIIAKYDELDAQISKEKTAFIQENPNSYASAYVFSRNVYYMDLEQMDKTFQLLSPAVQSSFYGKNIKEYIDANKRTAIGQKAPDFKLATPEGGELALSEIKGQKLLLIDFWASWCGPCRRENPNVVKMYEEYKGKGLEILGVSLDNKDENWKKAIEKDQLSWKHVSDLKGWSAAPAKLYGVRSIPNTFLINEKGEIIAKGLHGEELRETIKAYLN